MDGEIYHERGQIPSEYDPSLTVTPVLQFWQGSGRVESIRLTGGFTKDRVSEWTMGQLYEACHNTVRVTPIGRYAFNVDVLHVSKNTKRDDIVIDTFMMIKE
jgi:hypothetical protein